MKTRKMLSELVEVSRMEEDKEGMLRGGFVMISALSTGKITNGNCSCNTGDCSGNGNCECNSPICQHNANCTCNCNTVPPTTPPKVTPVVTPMVSPHIAGFGMFF